jgi:hypothetical protein
MKELIPYLWYLAGSLCFCIGTLNVIFEKIREPVRVLIEK